MALPVFRAASAKAAGTGAITPALPTGVVAGDIVILCATTLAGGTMSITNNGSISSWTEITSGGIDVTGGEKLWVWWGRFSSGSTGPTVTPGSDHACAGTVAYSGCVPNGSPIGVSATSTEVTSDTSFSFATGLTTGENDCMCICVCSQGNDSNTATIGNMANTSLTALANRQDFCTNSGGGGGYSLQEGAKATAGTMGTFTSTLSAASPKSYVAFSLRPAVAATVASALGQLSATGFLPTVLLPVVVAAGLGQATLTGFAPQVNLNIITAAGSPTITGFTPTVTAPNNQTVFPGASVLAANGFVPTIAVTNNYLAETAIGQVDLNAFTPVLNSLIALDRGQPILTGFEPTIAISDNISTLPGVGDVQLSGLASSIAVSDNQTVFPDVGATTVSAFVPLLNSIIATDVGQLNATGLVPDISLPVIVSIDISQLSLTGFNPSLSQPGVVEPNPGELTIDGFVPLASLTDNKIVQPGVGQSIFTISAPTIEFGIGSNAGNVIAAGFESTINISDHQIVLPDTGQLILTGNASTVSNGEGTIIQPATGELILIGRSPRITRTNIYLFNSDQNGVNYSFADNQNDVIFTGQSSQGEVIYPFNDNQNQIVYD